MIRRQQQTEKGECYFCTEKKIPDFLDYELLSKFTSERGKILARARTGVCSKHQRRVSKEIKRARFLSLVPYIVRPE